MNALPGLDGERRQQVAAALWNGWRGGEHGAALLTGFPGLGKSQRVVLPLVAQARAEGHVAVCLEVPASPTDLDNELLALLIRGLEEAGANAVATEIAQQPNFPTASRILMRRGGLIVLDEFQRLMPPGGSKPAGAIADQLRTVAERPRDGGSLWLVTNRMIDPEWSEPFQSVTLEPPSQVGDAVSIVLQATGAADAAQRFPLERRADIVERFGRNPRALRLLGQLLALYPIEELVAPPSDADAGEANEELRDRLERGLLEKARDGLSNAATELLRNLTALREPATRPLIDAMAQHLGKTHDLLRQLHERFLIELIGNRRQVHPIVREVEGARFAANPAPFHAAHRRAGAWFAQRLRQAASAGATDAQIALDLAGARYHLEKGDEPDALRSALQAIAPFIERRFNWNSRSPSNDAERDAQIGLLEAYLTAPGSPAVEFQLAKRLKARGQSGDLAAALPHAERATASQDFSHPWVLWAQLVYLVQGAEPAVAAARRGVAAVAPEKSLHAVYQLLGAALNHSGHPEESVEACLEGAGRCHAVDSRRLVEESLAFAAAAPSIALLERVRDWAEAHPDFTMAARLAHVLLLERAGAWRQAAEAARLLRTSVPAYLHAALHEALCWLGDNNAAEAQLALESLPQGLRHNPREGATWLAALVALRNSALPGAARLAGIYLDSPAPPTAISIEAVLLREWDHRVATIGEANPALMAPILPPSVTGLQHNVLRPQHGPPVLPQHQTRPANPSVMRRAGPRILAVGTEWRSGQGGLSTFNRQLCGALAAAESQVVCLSIRADEHDVEDARRCDIALIAATRTPGVPEAQALARRPASLPPGFEPDFIIGHGRVTGPAAKILAEDHFPRARRLHFVHMAPDEIEWHKLDRNDDAGARAEERTELELELGRSAHRVVAVGPRLYARYQRDLSAYPEVAAPLQFNPGFDLEAAEPRNPPPGAPWAILMIGRAEDERLKGVDLAGRSLGRVARSRNVTLPALELRIRGAKPEGAEALRSQVLQHAAFPALQVVVRPYTAEAEPLARDILTASLMLMPSRSEGFGLVGLEAIVAGTPGLISSNSGLGDLLRQGLEPEQFNRVVVQMTGSDDDDAERWAQSIDAVLRDRDASFRRACELQQLLGRTVTWQASVAGLLAAVAA